jgi:glycosyltransferase involved in cell wall biosynthesis
MAHVAIVAAGVEIIGGQGIQARILARELEAERYRIPFATGLPVISTPTGGIAELVREGETGVVVDPNDPVARAGAAERLLGDPQHARSMARRARRELEQYAWPHVRQGWIVAYHGKTVCAELQAS